MGIKNINKWAKKGKSKSFFDQNERKMTKNDEKWVRSLQILWQNPSKALKIVKNVNIFDVF